MDHQIQHHVNIQGARGEDAEAVNLEKHRLRQQGDGGANGGVEALEMPDLGHALVCGCQFHQFISFVERSRHRLLDQNVDAGFHQVAGHF